MNATHIIKSIAITTALGVFLTGCGGGPDNNHAAPTARTSTTNTGTPIVSPVTSGGSGVIGGNDTGTIDSVATAVNALHPKMDATLAAASAANSNSKKTKSMTTALIVLASIFGAAMIAKNVNIGMKVAKATGSTKEGVKAGLLGDSSKLNELQVNSAAAGINGNVNESRKIAALGDIGIIRGMGAIPAAVKTESDKTRDAILQDNAEREESKAPVRQARTKQLETLNGNVNDIKESQANQKLTVADLKANIERAQKDIAELRATDTITEQKAITVNTQLSNITAELSKKATADDVSDLQAKLSGVMKGYAELASAHDTSRGSQSRTASAAVLTGDNTGGAPATLIPPVGSEPGNVELGQH